MKIQKALFIASACIISLFLIAWRAKPVELLNGTKLINLNKAIAYVPPGGNEPHKPSEPSESEPDSPIEEEKETEPVVITIDIVVQGVSVVFNGKKIEETADVSSLIRSNFNSHTSFRLIDDFADANKYKEVCRLLNDLHNEIGVIFVEAQGGTA